MLEHGPAYACLLSDEHIALRQKAITITDAMMIIPYGIIAHYIGAEYLPPFTFHALEFFTEEEIRANHDKMVAHAEQAAKDLLAHLEKFA